MDTEIIQLAIDFVLRWSMEMELQGLVVLLGTISLLSPHSLCGGRGTHVHLDGCWCFDELHRLHTVWDIHMCFEIVLETGSTLCREDHIYR